MKPQSNRRAAAPRVRLVAACAAAVALLVALPAVAFQAEAGRWESRASSGAARQEVSYVELGGKLYLAGGSSRHQRYDPVKNSWTELKALPASIDHIQGVTVGGKIYYVGGLDNWPSPHVSTVYEYDPATDSLTTKAPMPRGRGAGGVAVHNGKIYYAGGLANGVAVRWFDVYDPATDSWAQLPDMPTARDHFHAVVLADRFWAIGGRNKDIRATTSANEAYDFASARWTTGHAPLPTPRGGFGAAGVGHEVLIVGGESYGKAHAEVEAYDVVRDSWRSLAPMPTPRHGIQGAVCNGGIYIAAGGIRPGHAPIDLHEAFYPAGAARGCSESATTPVPTPTREPRPTPSPDPRGVSAPDGQPAPAPGSGPPGPTDVAPDAGPKSPPSDARPEISELSVRSRRHHLAVRLNLSEPASLELRLQRARRGRRVGDRCRPAARRFARHRSCNRYVGVLSPIVLPVRRAGRSAIHVRSPRLRPGRYRAVAVAIDPVGLRSRPMYATLRVTRLPE